MSYSQVYQDVFAYKLISNKGFFLDIGAGDGFNRPNGGNSQFLEENGWTGILIEGNEEFYNYGKLRRSSKFINAYIPNTSILSILDDNNAPLVLDYVSMDIEPSTLIALENFPFNKYEIKVLTFEHDMYLNGPDQKIKSHEILKSLNYICLCDNVFAPNSNYPFEDWWVNPKYFSSDFIKNNLFNNTSGQYIVENIKI